MLHMQNIYYKSKWSFTHNDTQSQLWGFCSTNSVTTQASITDQREQFNVRAPYFLNKSRTTVQIELFSQAQRRESTRDKSHSILQYLGFSKFSQTENTQCCNCHSK